MVYKMSKILSFGTVTLCLVTVHHIAFHYNENYCINDVISFEKSLEKKHNVKKDSLTVFYGINSATRGVVFTNELVTNYRGPALIISRDSKDNRDRDRYKGAIRYICLGNKKPFPEMAIDEVKPIDYTTLMGFFHYNKFGKFIHSMGKYIPTWSEIWSRVFSQNNIEIVVPTGTNISNNNALSGNLRFYYPKDMLHPIKNRLPANLEIYTAGFVITMTHITRIVKEVLHEKGSLVHINDDVIISKSLLRIIGGKQWITTANLQETRKLYENGTIPGARIDRPCPYCKTGFSALFHDPRLKQYQKQTGDNRTYLDIVPQYTVSDFFYFSFHDRNATKAFLTLLDTFVEHKLFFEWAIPTALLLTQQKYGIEIHNANLCVTSGTDKEYFRLGGLVPNKACEVFHSIKMGKVGEAGWKRYFEFFTLNI